MTDYFKGVLLEDFSNEEFLDSDGNDFYVNDRNGYFEDVSNRQLNINTISFGTYVFSGDDVKKLKLHYEQGLLTDQLAIDTMSAEIVSNTKPDITRYTPITVYRDTEIMGIYFDGQIKEIGYNRYSLYAKSYISLLDYDYHFGGMYSGQTVGSIVAGIMGNISYTIHSELASIKIYGYLPYDTKRKNLQKLLFATGAAIRKNPNGTINITALTAGVVGTFDEGKSFVDGSAPSDVQVTAVQVTEHAYVAVSDSITLLEETFNNVYTVIFTEPVHDLSCVNGTILASGTNYAKIQGAGAVVLTGQKYRHTAKIVTAGTIAGTPDDKVLSITDVGLINAINSSSVAQRVYNYAKCHKTVAQDVLISQERTGDAVQIANPYGEGSLSATIQSLDFDLSNIMRASGAFLVDYVPQGISGGYQHQMVLTGAGNVTIPSGVTKYMAVLISGAQGGYGGNDGQSGGGPVFVWNDTHTVYDGGEGGAPGEGGQPGLPGRVLVVTVDTAEGSVIAYNCGVGGDGGTPGIAGASGTDTTLGANSSSLGVVLEDGYVDIFTGIAYAMHGTTGQPGAPGGKGSMDGVGADGNDTATGTGGTGGQSANGPSDDAGGGGGAGAAFGADGGNGTSATLIPSTGSHSYRQVSGSGGNGASPASPAPVSSGQGGTGGNGGGGGGGAGGYVMDDNGHDYYHTAGNPGTGGVGSVGGKGGNGLIIFYY